MPFTRVNDATIELRLRAGEADVLRQMFGMLELALAGGEASDALTRLFPPAYPDDIASQAEFASVTYDDLVESKRASIVRCVESLDDARRERGRGRRAQGDEGLLVVRLGEERQQAWLKTLNDLRLYLGTRLGVTEESAAEEPGKDDLATQVYQFLGWLQESLVQLLL